MAINPSEVNERINSYIAENKGNGCLEGKSKAEIISIMLKEGKLSAQEAISYQNSAFGNKPLGGIGDSFTPKNDPIQQLKNRFDKSSPMYQIMNDIRSAQDKYNKMTPEEKELAEMKFQEALKKSLKELDKDKSIPKEWLDNLKKDFKDVNSVKSFLKAVGKRIDNGTKAIDSITFDHIKLDDKSSIKNDFVRGLYNVYDGLFSTKGVMGLLLLATGVGAAGESAVALGANPATVATVTKIGFEAMGAGQAAIGTAQAITADSPEEMEQAGTNVGAGAVVFAMPAAAKGVGKVAGKVKTGFGQKGNTAVKTGIKPLDLTSEAEVLKASPNDVLRPSEAHTIAKETGITFKPSVDPYSAPAEAYKIPWKSTIEETLKACKKENIPVELVKDAKGKHYIGIKHSWDNDFYRIDRNSIAVKYGEGDWAPVAEDNGAHIFSKTYLDAETGKPIDLANMKQGSKIAKNPDATVGAIALDKPTTIKSLEGDMTGADMTGVDFARTDVDGHPYGTYEQLAKDINKGKIVADPKNSNSQKFIDLVKEGKKDDALKLLRDCTKAPEAEVDVKVNADNTVTRTTVEKDALGRITRKTVGNRVEEFNPENGIKTFEKNGSDYCKYDPETGILIESRSREGLYRGYNETTKFYDKKGNVIKEEFYENDEGSITKYTKEFDYKYREDGSIASRTEYTDGKEANRILYDVNSKHIEELQYETLKDGSTRIHHKDYNGNEFGVEDVKPDGFSSGRYIKGDKVSFEFKTEYNTIEFKFDKADFAKANQSKFKMLQETIESDIKNGQCKQNVVRDGDTETVQFINNKGQIVKTIGYNIKLTKHTYVNYYEYNSNNQVLTKANNYGSGKVYEYNGNSNTPSKIIDSQSISIYDKYIDDYVSINNPEKPYLTIDNVSSYNPQKAYELYDLKLELKNARNTETRLTQEITKYENFISEEHSNGYFNKGGVYDRDISNLNNAKRNLTETQNSIKNLEDNIEALKNKLNQTE